MEGLVLDVEILFLQWHYRIDFSHMSCLCFGTWWLKNGEEKIKIEQKLIKQSLCYVGKKCQMTQQNINEA